MVDLAREGVGIVILGAFSPTVFHPTWFGEQGLIADDEVERADIKAVLPELTLFTLPWLDVQVSQQRLELLSSDPVMVDVVRDLAAGTMRVLRGSRAGAIGINHYFHYAVKTMPHGLNRLVATPGSSEWTRLNDPVVTSLNIRAGRPASEADELPGYVAIQVEPSIQVRNGVFIAVNDHYDLSKVSPTAVDERIQHVLSDCWDASRAAGKGLADAVATATEDVI